MARKVDAKAAVDMFGSDNSELDDIGSGSESDEERDISNFGKPPIARKPMAIDRHLQEESSDDGGGANPIDRDYLPSEEDSDGSVVGEEDEISVKDSEEVMNLDEGSSRGRGRGRGRGAERGRGSGRGQSVESQWQPEPFNPPQNLQFHGKERVVPTDQHGLPHSPFWYFSQFVTNEIVLKLALWAKNYEQQEIEAKTATSTPRHPVRQKRSLDLSGITVTSGPSTPDTSGASAAGLSHSESIAPKPKSRKARTFTGSTIDEIASDLYGFIACLYTMGLWKHKNVLDYWKKEGGLPIVSELLPVDRFRMISRHLCLRNVKDREPPEEEKQQNRIWKTEQFVSHFQDKFSEIELDEYLATDEQMINFHGRSIIRQYMPKKPIKWGFKVWAIAGSNGFVHYFKIYQGKTTIADEAQANELGLTASPYIVYKLVEKVSLGYKGCKIFADRYFTSPNLARRLLDLGHGFIGTVDSGRLGRNSLKEDGQLKERGSMDSLVSTDGQVVVVRWKDNKSVTIISNYKGMEPVGEIERYDKSKKERVTVECPAIITEYNEKMGGVDLSDFLREMYSFTLKSRRWYVYVFTYLMHVSVRNAAILRKADLTKLGQIEKLDLKTFIWDVRCELAKLCSYSKTVSRSVAKVPEEARYDRLDHWPITKRHSEDPQTGKRVDLRSRCALCKRDKSAVWCSKCNVALCLKKDGEDCFVMYHKK